MYKDKRGNATTWKPLEAKPRLSGWENRLSVFNEQKFVTIQKQWQEQYAQERQTEETRQQGMNIESGGNQ